MWLWREQQIKNRRDDAKKIINMTIGNICKNNKKKIVKCVVTTSDLYMKAESMKCFVHSTITIFFHTIHFVLCCLSIIGTIFMCFWKIIIENVLFCIIPLDFVQLRNTNSLLNRIFRSNHIDTEIQRQCCNSFQLQAKIYGKFCWYSHSHVQYGEKILFVICVLCRYVTVTVVY